MLEQGVEHLWLDATGLERFAERFPTIAAELTSVGLDPADGLAADRAGRALQLRRHPRRPRTARPSLPGLWVAGEASCNGVMGANRLASNSLLDGMVFGPRVVEAIDRGVDGPEATGAMRALLGGGEIGGRPIEVPPADATTVPDRDALQRTMTTHAGVLRSAASLDEAAGRLRRARSPATTRARGSCATSPPSAACCARPPWPGRRAGAPTPAPTSTRRGTSSVVRFVAGG